MKPVSGSSDNQTPKNSTNRPSDSFRPRVERTPEPSPTKEFNGPRASGTPPLDQTFRGSVSEVLSFAKTLAVFLVLAFFLRASVVEAFKIPSGSMIPTLRIGDHILVLKFPYGFRLPLMKETLYQYAEPKRGDVVVFTRPDDPVTTDDESKINIIKRVIGLPGDIIEVRDAQLLINNKKYAEEYARWDETGIRDGGHFGPEKVPAGRIFLLGDNRDHSRDSRFWPDPFLPMNRVKGRAAIIYWSWYSFSRIGTLIQ